MQDEPMDLLFYGHRGSALESGTDSPVNILSHTVIIQVFLLTHRRVAMMIARTV